MDEDMEDMEDVETDETMGQEESKVGPDSKASTPVEEKLADEVRLRQYTEQVLDTRQQELEAQQKAKNDLHAELESLREELSHTKHQLAEARSQTRSKDKQLSDAKDHVFRLQSARKDITEAEAIETYRIVCSNVQRWVENRMKPILDDLDSGKLKPRPPSTPANRFVSFMRETGRRGIDIDQSDTYHVIAIVMNYLCIVFFSKSFYCPLDDYEGDSTLQFVNDLEASLSRLPRDTVQCREWRSETLTALTSQASFKARRTKFITIVAEDLAALLSVIVPKASESELQSSLKRTIVEPAADLAHKLHLAPAVYSMKWPARGAWSRLEVYECLNISSGGSLLDLSGTKPNSPARKQISYLFDVAPGLFVERMDGGKKMPIKAICKPTVLIHCGDEGASQKLTTLRWLWDSSNKPGGSRRSSPTRAGPRKSTSNLPNRQ